MRVANLTASISRRAGGLFEAILRLVQCQVASGTDARVFGIADELTTEDLGTWRPVSAMAFEPVGPAALGYSPRFSAALRAFEPEILHTHGLWSFASASTRAYGRSHRRPYVVSPHGMLDPWALHNSAWKKQLARLLFEGAHLRDARCLRSLCESETRSIQKLGLANDIAVIPNGIDLPCEPPRVGAPWQKSVPSGRQVALFLSRLHPKKGLPNLIRAWAECQPDRGAGQGEWVLAVAGWDQGGHEAELKRLITELGVAWSDVRGVPHRDDREPAVLFLGPQFGEAKQACYHHCDAFVLPSVSEGLPMVVLEAWAHGKPVLMTPECNLPEGFEAGAALRANPNVDSLVAGLRELRQLDAGDRENMGHRGRTLVEERFSWPRVASQMNEVYGWMLGGGARPGCVVAGRHGSRSSGHR